MTTIDDLINTVTKLDIPSIVGDAVEETKDAFIELQKDQMLHGKNSKGQIIGKYKSKYYERKKAAQNPYGIRTVDLKLKGPFQFNIKVKTFATSLEVFSTDEKMKKLTEKYGEEIFGLDAAYSQDYSVLFLKPEATRRIVKFITHDV